MTTLYSIIKPKNKADALPFAMLGLEFAFPVIRYYVKHWLMSGFRRAFDSLADRRFDTFHSDVGAFVTSYFVDTFVDTVSDTSKAVAYSNMTKHLHTSFLHQYLQETIRAPNTPYTTNRLEAASVLGLIPDGWDSLKSILTWNIPSLVQGAGSGISLASSGANVVVSYKLLFNTLSGTDAISPREVYAFLGGLTFLLTVSSLASMAVGRYCKKLCESAHIAKAESNDQADDLQYNVHTLVSNGRFSSVTSKLSTNLLTGSDDKRNHELVKQASQMIQVVSSCSLFILSFYFLKHVVLNSNLNLDKDQLTILLDKIFSETSTIFHIGQSIYDSVLSLREVSSAFEKVNGFINNCDSAAVHVAGSQIKIQYSDDASLKLDNIVLHVSNAKDTVSVKQHKFEFNQIYRVYGKSGVGKSSLMKMLCYGYGPYKCTGTAEITQNRYYLDTKENHGNKTIEQILNPDNNNDLKLAIMELIKGFKLEDLLSHASESKKQHGCCDVANRDVISKNAWSKLSTGQQKRISLIKAFLWHADKNNKNKLLILDEPFSGIDPETVAIIKEKLNTLKNDTTSLIIIHHSETKEVDRFYDSELELTRKSAEHSH